MKITDDIKKRKGVIISIIVMIMLTACSLSLLYTDYIKPLEIARERIITTQIGGEAIPLNEEEIITFTINPNTKAIRGISLAFDTAGGKSDTTVHVILKNLSQNLMLGEWSKPLSALFDGTFSYFDLEKEQKLHIKDTLEISIEVLKKDEISGGIYVNPNSELKNPAYEVLGGNYGVAKALFKSLVVALSIMIAILMLCLLREWPLEVKFAFIALWIGIIYSILIPQYIVPDEPAHFLTAYANSSRLLGEKDVDEEGKVILRKEDYSYSLHSSSPRREQYKRYIKGIIGRSDTVGEKIAVGKELDAPAVNYFPQILGVSFARLIHLNGEQLFLCGRLFALLAYILFVYGAIRIMPFAKEMLFVIGLLPMSMQEAVSYSYDSTVNGAAFLLIAYFFHLIYRKEKVEKKDIIVTTILTWIISPVKIVYVVIIGLGILIPKEKFKTDLTKWISAGIIGIAGVASIIISKLSNVNALVENSGNMLPWIDEAGYGVHNILESPIHSLGIFFRTFEKEGTRFLDTMIGSQLGWLEIKIPGIVITGFIILLLISMLKKENEDSIPFFHKIWMAFLSAAGILAVCLSMLIAWTRESALTIEGVQGRYFLPYLPMLLVILRNKCIVIKEKIEQYVVYGTVFLQISTMLTIFVFVMSK